MKKWVAAALTLVILTVGAALYIDKQHQGKLTGALVLPNSFTGKLDGSRL